jgi:hypothetical protein
MGEWGDFFAAQVGAAAALTGLVIVGISINVTRILAAPGLTGRAAETLVTPTGLLIASSCALVPHQPDALLGAELAATGIAMLLIPALIQIAAHRAGGGRVGPAGGVPRALLALLSSLPFIVAGVLVFVHADGALYWTVPGVVVALIATVINAWVLLIEILR